MGMQPWQQKRHLCCYSGVRSPLKEFSGSQKRHQLITLRSNNSLVVTLLLLYFVPIFSFHSCACFAISLSIFSSTFNIQHSTIARRRPDDEQWSPKMGMQPWPLKRYLCCYSGFGSPLTKRQMNLQNTTLNNSLSTLLQKYMFQLLCALLPHYIDLFCLLCHHLVDFLCIGLSQPFRHCFHSTFNIPLSPRGGPMTSSGAPKWGCSRGRAKDT